ncbi:tyrosyl-DNA phosphodiesterase-domain-containing protein [Mycena floridula]|nr:tyrosyl-DNA phosphodiesterase-domain-containing protein [Mycena floridula]
MTLETNYKRNKFGNVGGHVGSYNIVNDSGVTYKNLGGTMINVQCARLNLNLDELVVPRLANILAPSITGIFPPDVPQTTSLPKAGNLKFKHGTLRITRTPGREDHHNTVSLADLIDSSRLVSAFVFSFFIGQHELFDHFPFKRHCGTDTSKYREAVSVYVGRDVNLDSYLPKALTLAGLTKDSGCLNKTQLAAVIPHLVKLYRDEYGQNFTPVYPWSGSGCAHSSVLLLVYETFARVVITTANLMKVDTVLGDNHWYIHDLPRNPPGKRSVNTEFETLFLEHLSHLGCPAHYIEGTLRGHFDFSRVKVSLVTSKPGSHSGPSATHYGLLRLRQAISNLKLPKALTIEYCTGSIGNLNVPWLHKFYHCATGGQVTVEPGEDSTLPPIALVYPTRGDVLRCADDTQDGASNTGCHMKWAESPESIKKMFHHYVSKDEGRLFHSKFFMGLHDGDPEQNPLFVYVGSAGFSKAAWGECVPDRFNVLKMSNISNYECGVLIPGNLLLKLLESNSEWQDAVPYVRPLNPYTLRDKAEKPWNDPRWAIKPKPSQDRERSDVEPTSAEGKNSNLKAESPRCTQNTDGDDEAPDTGRSNKRQNETTKRKSKDEEGDASGAKKTKSKAKGEEGEKFKYEAKSKRKGKEKEKAVGESSTQRREHVKRSLPQYRGKSVVNTSDEEEAPTVDEALRCVVGNTSMRSST